jgi:hypothetical protein
MQRMCTQLKKHMVRTALHGRLCALWLPGILYFLCVCYRAGHTIGALLSGAGSSWTR